MTDTESLRTSKTKISKADILAELVEEILAMADADAVLKQMHDWLVSHGWTKTTFENDLPLRVSNLRNISYYTADLANGVAVRTYERLSMVDKQTLGVGWACYGSGRVGFGITLESLIEHLR